MPVLHAPASRARRIAIPGLVLAALFYCATIGKAQVMTLLYDSHGSSAWEHLPRVLSRADKNGNGISDTLDIVRGARDYVYTRPVYRGDYHQGGYPPAGQGVCTDVVWAAYLAAGYTLRDMIDRDARAVPSAYPRIDRPDANIDFRRVPNLRSFFGRHGTSLTTVIIPGDEENLEQWQPGDIVTFHNPDHIAILSDKRNNQGIPLLLHNDGPLASESDAFARWAERGITGHYRFPSP